MYNFKTTPYAHQEASFNDSWDAEYYALFMEMGLGKTKVAIDTMGALFEAGRIDCGLILAPKGVYDNWVKREIEEHMPERIDRQIMRWQPTMTQTYLRELREFAALKNDKILRLFVMNIESFSTPKGAETAIDFLTMNPNTMMIVDESTTIKNRQAARTKNIVKAGRLAKYRRILTGSPVTKSPLDLFSQCNFLSPNALGFQSFFAFQNRYAIVQSRTMGHRSFQEIVGYRRLEELSEKLETFSVRLLKEDCLDLPEKIYIRRDVALTKEQKSAYDQMKHIAMAQLGNGELATTQSVLTQIMRLQQICCGHLRTDEGYVNSLPNNRLSELLDIAEEVQGKVIIWATWTHDLLMIADALRRRYGPDSAATYYGGTPQDERQKIVTEFQDPESSLRFFVGQPKTGGYGITLTAANTMVYYSNSYDLEIRLQSEDRAHRIGQKNAVTYIDLVSPKTIDEKILQALRDKIDIAGKVLGENAKDWII
jgi:SNF2 family DNA or RNA helicase